MSVVHLRIRRGIFTAALAAFALVSSAAPQLSTPTGAAPVDAVRTITVTGEGQSAVRPDIATVYLAVGTVGGTAQEAMERNGQVMSAVLSSVRSFGVKDDDIQTTGIGLYPSYPLGTPGAVPGGTGGGSAPGAPAAQPQPAAPGDVPRPPVPPVPGYQASNSVTVTIRDLNKLVWMMDGAVAAGATMLSGVTFGSSDDTRAQGEALRAAVQAAQRKAEALAQAAGVSLDGVQSISEGSVGRFGPLPGQAPSADGKTPIAPGQLILNATVTASFFIK